MDIVIIGSGNVAAVLGRKFKAAGHNIIQVVGRNAKAASALAYEWNTVSTNYQTPISREADVYLIAVSDNAIDAIVDNLRLHGKVVAHTAAAVPKEVLKKVTDHYGVFYPLQSLRKDMTSLPDIPVFYDGSDGQTKKTLEKLAHSIAKEKVTEAGDEARLKLHVAAVIVSNFVNHLYTLAEEYCIKEGLDFKQLLPLIDETASRIKDISPGQTQTGPALRHDKQTISKHLELLKNHPQLKNIYLLMTESIQQTK
ncbi:MAG: F420-dependent NADP oxidoreductase [Bacteroidota bacterium]